MPRSCYCAAAGQLRAQGGTITGKVTAVNGGNPLAEARVLVIGTSVSRHDGAKTAIHAAQRAGRHGAAAGAARRLSVAEEDR